MLSFVKRKGFLMWSAISSRFFKGLAVMLPLLITIWLLLFLFSFMDGILGGVITLFIGRPAPGFGFIITLVLIFVAGYFTDYIMGNKILGVMDNLLFRVPIVKGIYSSAKQINDVFFQSGGTKEFKKACVVQYPREGIFSVGFITTVAAQEIQQKTNTDKLLCVFIPNTPTPATGFLIMLPAKDIIMLDMKAEDAFRLIVSGGVLKPAEKEKP